MFKNDMLNTDWLEDIYVILSAQKKGKATEKQAKAHLSSKHRQFKEHGNYSGMTDEELWNYCKENEEKIMNTFENLAV